MTEPAKKRVFHIGSPRTSQFKPDGTLNLEEPIGNDFDEVLDPLNDLLTGRNRSLPASRNGTPADSSDPIQTARERQKIERDLMHLQNNIKLLVGDMLAPQRVSVEGVIHDEAMNFTVFAINRGDGQRINATITVDEALGMTEFHERDGMHRLCSIIAERVLAARDRALS